jgi:hypothetical protein
LQPLKKLTIFFLQVEAYGGETQDLNFQLEVFPNGEEGEDNSDYVAVFLTSRRQEDLEVKYDFSVQKADGICWGRIGNTFKKFSPDQNSWGYGKAFSKAKLIEKQTELLPENKLTIVCNLVKILRFIFLVLVTSHLVVLNLWLTEQLVTRILNTTLVRY